MVGLLFLSNKIAKNRKIKPGNMVQWLFFIYFFQHFITDKEDMITNKIKSVMTVIP